MTNSSLVTRLAIIIGLTPTIVDWIETTSLGKFNRAYRGLAIAAIGSLPIIGLALVIDYPQ